MCQHLREIEDKTWLLGDMKFIFECSTRYLRYRVKHEKRNFISPSNHVLFCLFYKPTNNEVFDDVPKISDHFPKISEDFPKCCPVVIRMFPNFSNNFPRFPKIAGDCRRRSNSLANVTKSISSCEDMIFLSKRNPRNSL